MIWLAIGSIVVPGIWLIVRLKFEIATHEALFNSSALGFGDWVVTILFISGIVELILALRDGK